MPAKALSFVAAGFGATCLAFAYFQTLHPASFNFDASWYHYPVAQDYARIGCIVPFPGEQHRAFPHLTSIVHTWALLVPGVKPLEARWLLSLHLEYSIVVWRVVSVAALAQYLLNGRRVPGLWAFFFLFPSVFIYDQIIGGSADHFLGFFAGPIALGLVRTWRRFEWRWAVILGIVMGGHLLTKLQAVYLVVAATVLFVGYWGFVLVRHLAARRGRPVHRARRLRRLLLTPALAIAVTCAVSFAHFGKNAIFYHNPIYPYATKIFKSSKPAPSLDAKIDNFGKGAFAPKGTGIERPVWALRQLYEYSFTTKNRSLTDYRPYMGSLFSLLLPTVLFIRRSKRLWSVIALGAGAFLVWAHTFPNDRYLLSFYDLFIAAAAALAVRGWELGWLARVFIAPLVALQLIWGGDSMLFYGSKTLRRTMDLVAQGYEKKTPEQRIARQRVQQQVTAATPPDSVILVRDYKDLLGLDRTVITDNRANQFYIGYTGVQSTRQFWRICRDRGVTHLLYPRGQRTPSRINNNVLFATLFHGSTKQVRSFGSLALGTLETRPPEDTGPLYVLTRGVSPYTDGVYRVDQLDIDRFRKLPIPQPKETYSDSEAASRVAGVGAVVLGSRGRLPAEAKEELARTFVEFERTKAFTVYVRR
jgi:hypothetical protein